MFTLRTGARAQDNRGYSLVELLVTIAILTIIVFKTTDAYVYYENE